MATRPRETWGEQRDRTEDRGQCGCGREDGYLDIVTQGLLEKGSALTVVL